jgi:glyoxylase-like metal-dependent hydrolase (beta-lactamase superfamily II)
MWTCQYNPRVQSTLPILSPGLSYLDLLFLGRAHAIATAIAYGPSGVALIDPGPTTCLERLELGLQEQGLRFADVRDILLTHIHLDHGGATGTILRRYPHIRVVVHRRGAPHLIAPERLLESARRLWGDDMDRLWGEVLPVPEDRLQIVDGDEQVSAAGRTFDVAYTPGHASHHVSYFDRASGVALVGDTAGVSVDGGYVMPPTPPPDIDLELWRGSVARIEQWSPDAIFLTHFGPVDAVRPHLAQLLENLSVTADLVRASLEGEGSDEERSHRFGEDLRRELRRTMTDAHVDAYEGGTPFHVLWRGLARYWRKRAS